MNQALWQAHLESRVAELEVDIRRLRRLLTAQRARAAYWKHRALDKPKQRVNAGVRGVSGREPAHRPPSQRGGL